MSDWTDGYVSDVGYTYGYYTELNPTNIKLAFLNQGLIAPEVGVACELGFGQGLTANLHVAASTMHWYGTDFNPSQAGFARELASAIDGVAKFYDESFAEFAARSDLPEFDYICLHGIFSWISDENRAVIVDFIRSRLKVGGVLYISYNTQPAWSAMVPMRNLLVEHGVATGAIGLGIDKRVEAAIDFAGKLTAVKPAYLRDNPQVSTRIERMKAQNKNYVAHEYFNGHWTPLSFSDMTKWLAPAKLEFACSANYLDLVDSINLTKEQKQFLAEIPSPTFKQTVLDFIVNRQFRKDYWVKGARKLNSVERVQAIRKERVVLVTPRHDVSLKVTGALGEASMAEAVYSPILDTLASHSVMSLEEMERVVAPAGVGFSQLLQAMVVLRGTGHVCAAQDDATIEKAMASCKKLNALLLNKARSCGDVSYLASPVTGGGVAAPQSHQLFISALVEGLQTAEQLAHFTWQYLSIQGQRILKEGKTLESEKENLKELSVQADLFIKNRMPILKALKVV